MIDSLISVFDSLTTGVNHVFTYKENLVKSDNHTFKVLTIDD